MLSITVLVVVIGVAATVRRPVLIGVGNPKHDFFSGPLVESRQQSGFTAKPYWDRVRIPITVKSKSANQPRIGLRVRDSRTNQIVRVSIATVPAQRTYPTEPLWIEFRFVPIEDRFPATIEVYPLEDGESHRLYVGMSRGNRFEAGSLVPFEAVTGDQDLTFIYEGPESLLRHGAALVEHFMKEASIGSIAMAWALVLSSFVCLAALAAGLGPASTTWPVITRILVSLTLLVIAAEAAFLVADQVAGDDLLGIRPAPDRLKTAILIAWPMVAATLIVGLGRFGSGDRRYRVMITAKAARQLTITGIPLVIMAVAVMTFGNLSLGGNMVGGAAAILTAAAVLAALSAVAARRRFGK